MLMVSFQDTQAVMLKILLSRIKQGYRTMPYPRQEPTLPDRFRGRPVVDRARCGAHCHECASACPTEAITIVPDDAMTIDLGRCLFCTDCADACPSGAIRHDADYKLAQRRREDLTLDAAAEIMPRAEALKKEIRSIFGRSLRLRQVSAGGCNACEADTNVLGTIGWDLGRFGIQFVASPRHADGLLITGPVPENMKLGLLKTWEATPAPKIVIAVGACAISGGVFREGDQQATGAGGLVPVDLYIPGCPPHPLTILDGMLQLLGRLKT